MQKDAAALDEFLADDIVHIGFEGQLAGKAEYMAFFKRDIWQYRKYEPSNATVKVLGNAAVVTGRVDRTIVINNVVTTGAFAFTHVWSRTEDRWRMISSQVTTIPNPAPATSRLACLQQSQFARGSCLIANVTGAAGSDEAF